MKDDVANKIDSKSEWRDGLHRYMFWLKVYCVAVLAEEQLPDDDRLGRNM
jgi:hypothetical protein